MADDNEYGASEDSSGGFPNQDRKNFGSFNQRNYCWNLYNKWAVCMKDNGQDEDACKVPRARACNMCLDEDVEAWDEARDEENFQGIK
eukprot:CAMPEP_0113940544 /NCGR_PEP_ID=MMETSP1339-20121228/6652_1 /TAXON_ID=94617 /ORGANISM="Fibrocapsa japonica" /LENGTH=87 /DNA_ID=CAMNT_0000944409 /DNA_START=109 /DNA_END=372 /DNA_ORIENTATION=- /assembly_acc=CAM_ASM_000762